eukprot:397111_1
MAEETLQSKLQQIINLKSDVNALHNELKSLQFKSKQLETVNTNNNELSSIKQTDNIESKIDINTNVNSGVSEGDPDFEYYLRDIEDEWVKNAIRKHPWGTDGIDVLVLGTHKELIMGLLQKTTTEYIPFDESGKCKKFIYDEPMVELIKKYDNSTKDLGLVYGQPFVPNDISEMKEGDISHMVFFNIKRNAFMETKCAVSSLNKPIPQYGGFTAMGITNGIVNRSETRKNNAVDKVNNAVKTRKAHPIWTYSGGTTSVYSYRAMHLHVVTFGMKAFPMIYGSHLVRYSKQQKKEAEQDYLNKHQLVNGTDYDGNKSKTLNHDNAIANKESCKSVANTNKRLKYKIKTAEHTKKNIKNAKKYNKQVSKCNFCPFSVAEKQCEDMVGTKPYNTVIKSKDDAYNRITKNHWNNMKDGKHSKAGKRYDCNGVYLWKQKACYSIASSIGLSQRAAREKGKSDAWLRKNNIIDRCFTGFALK